MTAQKDEKSVQVHAVEELEGFVRAFADETREIVRPSDCGSILRGLGSIQTLLGEVYAALGRWHIHAVPGKHHAGDSEQGGDPEMPSWLRAGLALQEATQYSRDAVAAIDRARMADEMALWFDELQVDEDA